MTSSNRPAARAATSPLPPDSVFIACSCVVVATAAYLGLAWLRHPVLGMPFGLWLVIAEYGLLRLWRRRLGASVVSVDASGVFQNSSAAQPSAFNPAGKSDAPVSPGMTDQLSLDFQAPHPGNDGQLAAITMARRHQSATIPAPATPNLNGLEEALVTAASGVTRMCRPLVGPHRAASIGARLSAWHDSHRWPTRPIVIGVDLPDRFAGQLVRAGIDASVRWHRLGAGSDPERLAASGRFDAVVWRDADGHARAAMPERPGLDAAWYDWAQTPPFSYATVFPPRIDSARITLPHLEGASAEALALAGVLIETAAILSRTPARLTLADRLGGRRPFDAGRGLAGLETCQHQTGVQTGPTMQPRLNRAVAARLAWSVALMERCGDGGGDVERIAARVASAYLAASEWTIDPEERRRGIAAAARVLSGEPEASLRAVAACFACGDDEAGLRAVATADRAIRAAGIDPAIDPLKFLHSEMDLGIAGPMTFGRVAAGVALLCSTTPAEQLEYVKEDLREDLQFSPLFIGRDADLLTLLEIVRVVERERRGMAKAA